jgi:2-polyprenyl-3-methyl-5-hydroxy-6-metoxy-1,4-benzoquinol methylase
VAKLGTPDLTKFTNYEYKFNPKGDSSAAAILRFVDQGSKVLDIGAGSGSITRALVDVKKCDVVALENNEAAVAKLKTFCKGVCVLDLNDKDWAARVPEIQRQSGRHEKFDYVIAGDVLEHLYDPWTTLKGMASLLNEKGRVIVSVPHWGHSSVVAAFFNSYIPFQESGILDKTHIRFFGLQNIDELYDGAGLAITRVHYVIRTPEVTELASDWSALPENVRQMLKARECADVYQVVTEAAPRSRVANPIRLAGSGASAIPKLSGLWERLFPRR